MKKLYMTSKRKGLIIAILTLIIFIFIAVYFLFLKPEPTMLNCPIIESLKKGKSFTMYITNPISSWSFKEIKDQNLILEICEFLEEIKIQPKFFSIETFYPTYGDSYIIEIWSLDKSEYFHIGILNKQYLAIYNLFTGSDKYYYIKNSPDLSNIMSLLTQYGYLEDVDAWPPVKGRYQNFTTF